MSPARMIVADACVLLATVMMTLAVIGLVRFRDTYAKIHASSKAALLAIALTFVVALVSGDPRMIGRAALVSAFLLLTTPVGAHALGRLAWLRQDWSDRR